MLATQCKFDHVLCSCIVQWKWCVVKVVIIVGTQSEDD